MNELSGLDWSKTTDSKNNSSANYSSAFTALRPTPPISGRSTPLNTPTLNLPTKSATPVNDSFSNLVSFSSTNSNKNLSLQEQQKRLAEQKRGDSNNATTSKVWAADEQIWNNLGSGRSTPATRGNDRQAATPTHRDTSHDRIEDDDEDFLAAFNAPKTIASTAKPISSQPAIFRVPGSAVPSSSTHVQDEDNDDPFELSKFKATTRPSLLGSKSLVEEEDDDDVLGLLGQPADRRPRSADETIPHSTATENLHPQEKAVAELVDMGFPADKAREGLESTESGMDVQAAVSWLLNQSHAEARERSRPRGANGVMPRGTSDLAGASANRGRASRTGGNRDQCSTVDDDPSLRRREDSSTASAQREKDPAQLASEMGTTFLKTAGSLWKQGTKKVQQAYQEFNSDSDSSQPKWMRETSTNRTYMRQRRPDGEADRHPRRRRSSATQEHTNATDEALMLEANGPPLRQQRRKQESRFDSSADTSRDHSPAIPSRLRDIAQAPPAFLQQQNRTASSSSRTTLNRQIVEEQASQAYVSSARRRKPQAVIALESDLLDGSSTPSTSLPYKPSRPSSIAIATARSPKTSTPVVVRPLAPTRPLPPISAIALKASDSHRAAGNASFRLGNYSAAHQSYSASLSHLPASHSITMVLLTNRALTALKIGEPKAAIIDGDRAIAIAGPSKGENETVDLQNGEPPKPMREYYGKALMRKAEALEQLEKWLEAASVWREAVEGGHGGATSIQGRMRAEKAANPPPITKAKSAPPKPKKPSTAAASRSTAGGDVAAVERLRAANAAADRVDDEKFALSDFVDARINGWRGGKADNLRALLGSLDTVLWPEAGWKKISLADLVLPGKVKIQYMKGIGKVHPDKIPTTATTEQRMIAGAVFSTLNEAWDKFKSENGL